MPTRVANNGEVEAGGYAHGLPRVDEMYRGDQRFLMGKNVIFKDIVRREEEKGLVKNSVIKSISCSDESSSIGRNSDISEGSVEKSGDGEEVQSSYKGPLDAMTALEEVLPIRKGISRFYNGKSKSFATLADVSCSSSSIKDIAKQENAYTRRRRNLLACNLNWDKTRSSSYLRSNGGGISKRVTGSSRTTLALAVAMNNSEESEKESLLPVSSGRKDWCCWRSFSFADLQHCVTVSNSNQVAGTNPLMDAELNLTQFFLSKECLSSLSGGNVKRNFEG